jgi:hypothetical protein
MSRRLTEQTVCGVRLEAFAKQPTPEELGAIVAAWTANTRRCS